MTIYLKLITAMFLWGGTFVSGRILAQSYHPYAIAFWRFAIASVVLGLAMIKLKKGFPKLNFEQAGKLALLGFTGVFAYNYLFFSGLATVPAGRASVIIAINPTISAFIASFFMGEGVSLKKSGGTLLAFLGALFVITKGEVLYLNFANFTIGEFYLLLAVVAWVAYTLIGKVALKVLDPLEATFFACVAGMFMLAPFAYAYNGLDLVARASPYEWWHLFYLGTLGTGVGFIWFYQGIKTLGASRAASFINFVPVAGLAISAIVLKESFDSSLIIGAVLVLVGVRMVNKGHMPR